MYNKPSSGWIEVICGSMFSGKTEELIRRVRRAQIARQKVQVFKPAIDTRYARREVTSHNGMQVEAVPVKSIAQLRALIEPGDAGYRRRAGYGLSGGAIRASAHADGGGGASGQAPGHLRGMRRAGQPHAAVD